MEQQLNLNYVENTAFLKNFFIIIIMYGWLYCYLLLYYNNSFQKILDIQISLFHTIFSMDSSFVIYMEYFAIWEFKIVKIYKIIQSYLLNYFKPIKQINTFLWTFLWTSLWTFLLKIIKRFRNILKLVFTYSSLKYLIFRYMLYKRTSPKVYNKKLNFDIDYFIYSKYLIIYEKVKKLLYKFLSLPEVPEKVRQFCSYFSYFLCPDGKLCFYELDSKENVFEDVIFVKSTLVETTKEDNDIVYEDNDIFYEDKNEDNDIPDMEEEDVYWPLNYEDYEDEFIYKNKSKILLESENFLNFSINSSKIYKLFLLLICYFKCIIFSFRNIAVSFIVSFFSFIGSCFSYSFIKNSRYVAFKMFWNFFHIRYWKIAIQTMVFTFCLILAFTKAFLKWQKKKNFIKHVLNYLILYLILRVIFFIFFKGMPFLLIMYYNSILTLLIIYLFRIVNIYNLLYLFLNNKHKILLLNNFFFRI